MQTTAHFVFWTIFLQTLIGFTLAYLLDRKFRGHGFWTTLILIPMMLSPAVVGNFWAFLYQPQTGLFNVIASFISGVSPSSFSMLGEVPLAPDVMAAYTQMQATKLDAFPTKEQAVSAGYDLAIIAFPGYVYDASRGRASREEWEQAGTVLYESNADCADGGADRTLEDSFQQIRDIGLIFNVPERAEALIAEMNATLTLVEKQVAGQPTPKAAILDYIDENGVPSFYAAGIYTDLIARAGGENVFADQPEQYATISPEVVATRPVDLLFVMEWAGGITAAEKAEYYFKTFPNAPASQNRRFVVLTNMELNAGSGNALAIEKMARGLHPEAFE